jgi:UDP-GlcNAc:undecaprenyl-phosphate GlcNAc-1-phosphate transferase
MLNFFLIPLLATFFLVAPLQPCAEKIGLIDKPCHRKQHQKHIPLIGGLAIYLAVLVTFYLNDNSLPNQAAFIAAATLLTAVGLVDDYKGLGVKIRMVTQIAAVLIMTQYTDIKIETLGDLFGCGEIQLGLFATVFTIFTLVGGINAFNMIDGMDGLAGSLALISIASLAGIAWLSYDDIRLHYCLIFIAALIAFLSLNLRIFGRSNALIFLGDTGSTLLGFSICWLAIDASQGEKCLISPATVLWIIAVPLFDTVCIMLRRLMNGRSPFEPDREHIHHILLVAGYSTNFTLAILVISSLVFSLIGIMADRVYGVPEVLSFGFFVLIFCCHYWLMNYSWKILKIARYLGVTKKFDRRAEDQRKIKVSIAQKDLRMTPDRRFGTDRRYIPTKDELDKFYRSSNRLWVRLLTRLVLTKEVNKGDGNFFTSPYPVHESKNPYL